MKKSRKKHSLTARKKMSLTRIKKYGTKINIICQTCDKTFSGYKNRKYCSLECAYKNHNRVLNTIKTNKKGFELKCPQCGKLFWNSPSRRSKTKSEKIFCSQKCFQLSRKVKRKCKLCGKIFYKRKSQTKFAPYNFCSHKCRNIVLGSLIRKPESYIKGSKTRRKKGSYSANNQYSYCKRGRRKDLGNVFFRSSWEANTARLLNFQKRKWKYEIKTFWFLKIKRGVRSYTPDFYLPEEDIYIEVKGWWDKKSLTKMKRMKKYYPDIKIEIWDNEFFKEIKRKGINKLINNWE